MESGVSQICRIRLLYFTATKKSEKTRIGSFHSFLYCYGLMATLCFYFTSTFIVLPPRFMMFIPFCGASRRRPCTS